MNVFSVVLCCSDILSVRGFLQYINGKELKENNKCNKCSEKLDTSIKRLIVSIVHWCTFFTYLISAWMWLSLVYDARSEGRELRTLVPFRPEEFLASHLDPWPKTLYAVWLLFWAGPDKSAEYRPIHPLPVIQVIEVKPFNTTPRPLASSVNWSSLDCG